MLVSGSVAAYNLLGNGIYWDYNPLALSFFRENRIFLPFLRASMEKMISSKSYLQKVARQENPTVPRVILTLIRSVSPGGRGPPPVCDLGGTESFPKRFECCKNQL